MRLFVRARGFAFKSGCSFSVESWQDAHELAAGLGSARRRCVDTHVTLLNPAERSPCGYRI